MIKVINESDHHVCARLKHSHARCFVHPGVSCNAASSTRSITHVFYPDERKHWIIPLTCNDHRIKSDKLLHLGIWHKVFPNFKFQYLCLSSIWKFQLYYLLHSFTQPLSSYVITIHSNTLDQGFYDVGTLGIRVSSKDFVL